MAQRTAAPLDANVRVSLSRLSAGNSILLGQTEEEVTIPLRACDLLGDGAQGGEAASIVFEAVVEHPDDNRAILVVLHEQRARHRQSCVMLRRDGSRRSTVEGDPFPPPREVLSNANAQFRIACNLKRVLAGGFRQTAVFARLHMPGELPAEMPGVLHDRL